MPASHRWLFRVSLLSLSLLLLHCGNGTTTFFPEGGSNSESSVGEASVSDARFDVPNDLRPTPNDGGMDAINSESGADGNGGGNEGGVNLEGGQMCSPMEVCGDGADNNCDGRVDENCVCVPGEMARCYRGGAGTRGVGACLDGMMVCLGGSELGNWGPCMGDRLPSMELCDPGQVDEDCDGTRNENCECAVGSPPVPCGSMVGACRQGTQSCVDGRLGACTGGVLPTMETCNNIDDDCDGMVDEELSRPCGSMIGACRMGVQSCTRGTWGTCSGGVSPQAEQCNNVDDDCNGMVDDNVRRACGSSSGVCRQGMQTCATGMWGMCMGATDPTTETCNNQDDDCDGIVDEDLMRPCGSSMGICRMGTQRCGGGMWGTCTGEVAAMPREICEGMLDENCNGAVDEGCSCTRGQTRACGSMVGACRQGMQTCDDTGNWGMCMGGVAPTAELCDMIDNDCDGMTDEGCGLHEWTNPFVWIDGWSVSFGIATLRRDGNVGSVHRQRGTEPRGLRSAR